MKIFFAPLLFAAAAAASAQASYSFGGTTTGKPTFVRPNSLLTLDPNARQVAYDVVPFRVTQAGSYTYESGDFGMFDGFILAYQDAFDPTKPLQNLINGDDDYTGAFTVMGGVSAGASGSRISATNANGVPTTNNFAPGGLLLSPGHVYYAVQTAFGNGNPNIPTSGFYVAAIGGGPGDVQAVPEPATLAALGLGALGFLKRRKRA